MGTSKWGKRGSSPGGDGGVVGAPDGMGTMRNNGSATHTTGLFSAHTVQKGSRVLTDHGEWTTICNLQAESMRKESKQNSGTTCCAFTDGRLLSNLQRRQAR